MFFEERHEKTSAVLIVRIHPHRMMQLHLFSFLERRREHRWLKLIVMFGLLVIIVSHKYSHFFWFFFPLYWFLDIVSATDLPIELSPSAFDIVHAVDIYDLKSSGYFTEESSQHCFVFDRIQRASAVDDKSSLFEQID
jgi:hypothetical protein